MPTPKTRTPVRAALLAAALGLALDARESAAQAPAASPAPGVTAPKAFFGFNVGDDYCLANYRQMSEYFSQLEKDSDRIKVIDIGATEENRRQLAAVVTSPANLRALDRYREIARRLARADGVGEAEARKLAAEGKAVVWIDAGIHATETLCPQALIETVYQLVAGRDAETLRLLDDVIVLFVHANPDGHDLVADWYMREKDPAKRSFAGLPRLYQKYTGHDLNRDFYANTQAETKNLNRLMYREWFPQIMCNHHQTGPAGTVLFCAPFRDPFNYFCDPLVINGVDAVGAAVVQRFLAEGKPGATTRSGASYSTWFNGGLRTTAYFHNIIGLLTEAIGSPTPGRIALVTEKQLPKGDYLAPVEPQPWHFRQSVDYSVTCDKAILDYAARNREPLLYNIWRMGRNAIERGSRDSWTTTPKIVEAAKADAAARRGAGGAAGGAGRRGGGGGGRGGDGGEAEFERLFHDKARRDARGYVVPSDQPDFLTATKFVNALLGTGVRVHRAADDFTVAGKSYPRGSFVVKSAQAFRAHVLDMFEPQDHPNDFAYPGAPPTRPYDSAGYTLAFQMGVKFDRVLDDFDGPFEEVEEASLPPRPAPVERGAGAVGYFLDARANDAFRAVNRLRKAGEEVRRLQKPAEFGGETVPAGTFYVPRKEATPAVLGAIAAEVGTPFRGTPVAPGDEAAALREARVGLWDRYGGSMPSGWTRWILERFEFPFKVVYAPELDAGGLREKFDVLVLVDGAYPLRAGGTGPGGGERPEGGDAAPAGAAPNERPAGAPDGPREQRGRITRETTLPQFKKFLEDGGTILAIGSSTGLARDLGLPLEDHLTEADAEGKVKPLPSDKYYVPSSVLRLKVDPADPLAWGLGDDVDVVFSTSPTFRLAEGASDKGLRPVGWFNTRTPLRSGWAWGQEHLDGGVAVIDARVGKGRLALFGPQVLFRGQSHGTFKFVFNGIVQSVVEP